MTNAHNIKYRLSNYWLYADMNNYAVIVTGGVTVFNLEDRVINHHVI